MRQLLLRLLAIGEFIRNAWHWRKARTFQDLLDINYRDIKKLRDNSDFGGANGDTAWWTKTCAELGLNEVGMLTTLAVLGCRWEEDGIEGRAAVTGFADEEVKDWLDELLYGTSYEMKVLELFGSGSAPEDTVPFPGVPTTRAIVGADDAYLPVGGQQSASEIFWNYPVRLGVAAQLHRRWQVTVFDPQWGESKLFDFLYAATQAVEQENTAS